jgi:hypothetical protein
VVISELETELDYDPLFGGVSDLHLGDADLIVLAEQGVLVAGHNPIVMQPALLRRNYEHQ